MSVFDNVKAITEKTSDAIPEIKQTVGDIDSVMNNEIKPMITHLDELIVALHKKLPFIIACLSVMALAALGTMIGVVVLLVAR